MSFEEQILPRIKYPVYIFYCVIEVIIIFKYFCIRLFYSLKTFFPGCQTSKTSDGRILFVSSKDLVAFKVTVFGKKTESGN